MRAVVSTWDIFPFNTGIRGNLWHMEAQLACLQREAVITVVVLEA